MTVHSQRVHFATSPGASRNKHVVSSKTTHPVANSITHSNVIAVDAHFVVLAPNNARGMRDDGHAFGRGDMLLVRSHELDLQHAPGCALCQLASPAVP